MCAVVLKRSQNIEFFLFPNFVPLKMLQKLLNKNCHQTSHVLEVCLQYGSQGHVISRKSKAKDIFIIWLLQPRGAYPLPKNV